METNREPLLLKKEKVVYYEKCPGCKQDQKKEANTGIPYKEFIYIWVVALCTALPISSLFPYLYFMAYATEVCRKEHQALGLSLVSTSRGIGLIIGPAIGGYLSQPAEKFPSIFAKESFFRRFPYLLPNLSISMVAVGSLIACFWLPETLHMHGDKVGCGEVEALEASRVEQGLEMPSDGTDEISLPTKKSLFRNWSLVSTIIVYCVFSLHDTAYSEIFSLWTESDKRFGGLSFTSNDVGNVLAISGFSLLLYQLFLYPRLERALGPLNSSRVAAVMSLPVLACYPYMAKLSGLYLTVVVTFASVIKNVLSPNHSTL